MKTSPSSRLTSGSSEADSPGAAAEPAPRTAWGRAIRRAEDAALAALLGGMILLSTTQILLRNLAQTGVPWVDPLLRAMVLWVGLAAAVVAARSDRHISMDFLSRFLPGRAAAAARMVTSLFAAAVAGAVAFHGGRFVVSEREAQTAAFAGLPAWVVESIIPFAFGWIALHYLALFLGHAGSLLRPRVER